MSWYDRASCRDINTDNFYGGGIINPTSAILGFCRGCPVRQECFEEDFKNHPYDMHGVWGGVLRDERRRMKREVMNGARALYEAMDVAGEYDDEPPQVKQKFERWARAVLDAEGYSQDRLTVIREEDDD